MVSLEDRIKKILVQVFGIRASLTEIGDDEILFRHPFSNNPEIFLKFISELEKELGLNIEDDDLTVERFFSVKTIANYMRDAMIPLT